MLSEGVLGIRGFYLIVRALLGLVLLEKGHKLVGIQDVLELNHSIF